MNAETAGRGSWVAGRGYQQLRAWQKAHGLALVAFRLSETFRSRHPWLATQLARAALSVPANIAEGYNRGSLREYIQFLTISRGSLAEVEYYALFAKDAQLTSANDTQELSSLIADAGNLLLGLIRSLRAKGSGSARSPLIRDDRALYDTELESEEPHPLAATRDPRPATLIDDFDSLAPDPSEPEAS